jgi:hypothetical protein
MEAEDSSHRAHSFSSDMMATIRDDPEKYRHLVVPPVKKEQQQPAPAEPQTPAPDSNPARAQPPTVVGFNYPQAANIPSPPAKSNNRSYLILGISVVVILILLFVILFAYKVI